MSAGSQQSLLFLLSCLKQRGEMTLGENQGMAKRDGETVPVNDGERVLSKNAGRIKIAKRMVKDAHLRINRISVTKSCGCPIPIFAKEGWRGLSR